MLTIICDSYKRLCERPNFLRHSSAWFDSDWDERWLQDEFARRVISDIDNIELGENTRVSLAMRGQTVEELAGTTKSIIACQRYPEYIVCLQYIGSNAYKYLYELAGQRDVTIATTCVMYEMRGVPVTCDVKVEFLGESSPVLHSSDDVVEWIDYARSRGAFSD